MEMVKAVLDDYRSAPVGAAEKALLSYVEKLTLRPGEIGPSDVQQLREKGWTDEAIYDAVMVCGLFSFYNRWVDGTGVHAMADEDHRASGKRLAARGYLMNP